MLTINLSGLDQAQRLGQFRFPAVAAAWATEVEPMVVGALKNHAPVGQGPTGGRFRDSIRPDRHITFAGLRLEFTARVPYARFVIDGTPPHLIRPRAAKALYWVDGRGGHFARIVRHPGTKPNRFVERAVHPLTPLIRRSFVEATARSVRG
jgi:hypothetical protein